MHNNQSSCKKGLRNLPCSEWHACPHRCEATAQQRYFSYRVILVAIVDTIEELFRACFYRVSHTAHVICCKMWYRTDVPVKLSTRGQLHPHSIRSTVSFFHTVQKSQAFTESNHLAAEAYATPS